MRRLTAIDVLGGMAAVHDSSRDIDQRHGVRRSQEESHCQKGRSKPGSVIRAPPQAYVTALLHAGGSSCQKPVEGFQPRHYTEAPSWNT